MKQIFLSAALLIPILGYCQTTFFSDQYGMPAGSATRSGNMTYFNDANGMPQGNAIQSGNTTYFSNQYGMPVGSATAPPQATTPQIQPIYPAPTQQPQPYRKW